MKKIILLILITLNSNANSLYNLSKSLSKPLVYKGEGHMILSDIEGGNPFIYPITIKTTFEPQKDIDKGRHLFITKEEMTSPLPDGGVYTQKMKTSIVTDSDENILIIERITEQDGEIDKVYCVPQSKYNRPIKDFKTIGYQESKRFYKCSDKTIQAGIRYLSGGSRTSGNLVSKNMIIVNSEEKKFYVDEETIVNLEKDGTINYILGSSSVEGSMVTMYKLEKYE